MTIDDRLFLAWTEWCSCPEAVEAGAKVAAERERLRAEAALREAEERRIAELEQYLARIQRAQLPSRCAPWDFDTFPDDPAKRAAVTTLRGYADTSLRRGVFLWGATGTGKTGLSVSALKLWIGAGGSGLFVSTSGLLDSIKATFGRPAREDGPTGHDIFERAASARLLVLDELGGELPTAWVRERLFRLIGERHAQERPMLITSNYSLDETAARLARVDSGVEAERIAWRIKEACDVIELRGRNLRA